MHEYGVLVMRAQPYHNAHQALVRFALSEVNHLIVVIGSCNAPRDTVNPFSGLQRREMIERAHLPEELSRMSFVLAKDYQSNNMWLAAVQSAVEDITDGHEDVKLVGHRKDASSFYLRLFPQWGPHLESGSFSDLDATQVRENLFRQDKITVKSQVPKEVYDYLSGWMTTPEFDRLHGEFQQIIEDKAKWDGAPYQPTFVTTDAVVVCSGHVLVVRRGGRYGKGLIAWPGGYINANELVIDSCVRELKEETGIRVERDELKKLVIDREVFDNPRRDQRGRVITHAFCIKLPDGPLPRVKGMDDADKAWWMTVHEFHRREEEFFADHYKIGCRFVDRF